jgi:3-oxoacyl-[acyl-carrier protein] reductase
MTDREVVLITGASRGIGRFLAEHFSKKGALVEGCSRNAIDWELDNYTHHVVDITSEKSVKSMLSSIRNRHNRIDITINNAGMASMNHTLLTPFDSAMRIMNTNFMGTFLVSRECVKIMSRNKFGRIVNIGSVAVPMCVEGEAVYASSKSAIEMFTKIFAYEIAEYGITCNVVGASPIDTDLIGSVAPEKIQRLVDRMAIKRKGRFEDVANVVDFFVKPESEYITGQIIYLGGV